MNSFVTYHNATYESPAQSFNVRNPYSFSGQGSFQPSENFNYSYDVPDSDIEAAEVYNWSEPNSEGISSFVPESISNTLMDQPSFAGIPEGTGAALEGATFGAGMAIPAAMGTNAILNYSAQKQFQSDMQGNSVAGHSFLSPLQAESNLQVHNLQNTFATAAVGAGALLGPEGLAAGLAAGAVISSIDFTSPVTVPTDTGEVVSAAQLGT